MLENASNRLIYNLQCRNHLPAYRPTGLPPYCPTYTIRCTCSLACVLFNVSSNRSDWGSVDGG